MKGCIVKPSVTVNQPIATSFWGHIRIDVSPIFDMRLKFDEGEVRKLVVTFTSTVATIIEMRRKGNRVLNVAVVGEVTPGWRQFLLVFDDNYTLVDHHNTTWIAQPLQSPLSYLTITINNFNTTCYTRTPTWAISSTPTEVAVTPHQDVLEFTLMAGAFFLPELTISTSNNHLGRDSRSGVVVPAVSPVTIDKHQAQSHDLPLTDSQYLPEKHLPPDEPHSLYIVVNHTGNASFSRF
ncbi:hypothetical protein Hamer_G000905, partial [Homarus americanus]